jgi:hypothetical protein
VLNAGNLAKGYPPDLEVVGVAAAAPATDIGKLMTNDLPTPGGKNLLAMTLWSWSRVFGAPIEKVVLPAAIPVIDRLASVCLESPIDIFPRREDGRELQKGFLSVDDIVGIEPWRTLLAENTIGTLPPDVPIFLSQGTADDTIAPSVTAAYKAKLCAAGSNVKFVSLPGVGHGLAAHASLGEALVWMRDRFAGSSPPSDCGS